MDHIIQLTDDEEKALTFGVIRANDKRLLQKIPPFVDNTEYLNDLCITTIAKFGIERVNRDVGDVLSAFISSNITVKNQIYSLLGISPKEL